MFFRQIFGYRANLSIFLCNREIIVPFYDKDGWQIKTKKIQYYCNHLIMYAKRFTRSHRAHILRLTQTLSTFRPNNDNSNVVQCTFSSRISI